ncbi:unnamed protein product [Heterobilharzia americana]|nr:unnamed protein product [Heterobilharzia americana]
MHVFRLCLLLGCIAPSILNAWQLAFVTPNFVGYGEAGSANITVSYDLYSGRKVVQKTFSFILLLERYSYPRSIPGFWFISALQNISFENLYRVITYTQTASDSKISNATLNTSVYGLLFLSRNKVTGYVSIPSSEIYPSGATFFIKPVKSKQRNDYQSLHSSTIHHQSSIPHNLTIYPVDVITLENHIPPSSLIENPNQFESIDTSAILHSPEYNDSDLLDDDKLTDPLNNLFKRVKRSSETSINTPTLDTVRVVHRPGEIEPYIMELFMVVDETLAAEFRGQYDQLVHRVNLITALVNKLFAPFNIVIVIVRLEIWEQDRISLKVEEHHILTSLAQFKRMHTDVRHDCLHALLGTKEQGSRTRGKANHMTMCIYSRCVGYSRVSPSFDVVETARTMAHELGHNFGLRHDTEECECQGCIMATGVEFGTTVMEWSPCSMRDLPGLLKYGMGVCLHDLPTRGSVSVSSFLPNSKSTKKGSNSNPQLNTSIPSVVHIYDWQSESKRIPTSRLLTTARRRHSIPSSNQFVNGLCGNGLLDPGEECDCGTRDACPKEWQACCNPARCMLRDGSECAGGPCCDIIKTDPYQNGSQSSIHCKLKSAGTICRNQSGSCDLPEYCDGHSQWCPADVYKADGELCYTDEDRRAHCVRGGCREADGWCRVLWGKTGTLGDKYCFYNNEVWDRKPTVDSVANCGIYRPPPRDRWEDVKTWTGKACETWHDTSCGRLWCHHQNEKAMLLGWVQSQTRVIHSTGRSCSALVYDPVWPASDSVTQDKSKLFQINPNGAGFGLYAGNTQDAGMVPDGTPCSRGICNNLGHCHCTPGYKPPYCEEGGNGGSIDSGPPPVTSIKDNTLLVVICLLFFVILPLVGFAVYFLFIRSGKCILSTSKEFIHTSSGLRNPCDRSCTECICHLCRRRNKSKQTSRFKNPYPLLAYTTDVQDTSDGDIIKGQVNGCHNYKSNGKLSNGIQSKSVSFETSTTDKISSNFVTAKTGSHKLGIPNNTIFTGSETARTAKTTPKKCHYGELQTTISTVISKSTDQNEVNVQDKRATQMTYPKYVGQTVHKTIESQHSQPNGATVKPSTFISEPRLETMTYDGPMCSLNDPVVIDTIKRKSKDRLVTKSKCTSLTNDSQPEITIKQKPQQKLLNNPVYALQTTTTLPVRPPLSSKDISEPLLQTTTYNETLSDLQTARLKLSKKVFEL